jgi:hypothetical protein
MPTETCEKPLVGNRLQFKRLLHWPIERNEITTQAETVDRKVNTARTYRCRERIMEIRTRRRSEDYSEASTGTELPNPQKQ